MSDPNRPFYLIECIRVPSAGLYNNEEFFGLLAWECSNADPVDNGTAFNIRRRSKVYAFVPEKTVLHKLQAHGTDISQIKEKL